MSDLQSPFLTTSQAAAYLGLKPSTLETWRTRRGGPYGPPFSRLGASRGRGGRVVYSRADLDAWAGAQRVRPRAAGGPPKPAGSKA